MAEKEEICNQPVEEWIHSLEFETTDQVKIPPKLADQVSFRRMRRAPQCSLVGIGIVAVRCPSVYAVPVAPVGGSSPQERQGFSILASTRLHDVEGFPPLRVQRSRQGRKHCARFGIPGEDRDHQHRLARLHLLPDSTATRQHGIIEVRGKIDVSVTGCALHHMGIVPRPHVVANSGPGGRSVLWTEKRATNAPPWPNHLTLAPL